jgi:hypothetical protein
MGFQGDPILLIPKGAGCYFKAFTPYAPLANYFADWSFKKMDST